MICFGDVPSGAVLPVLFDSFAGATGASITLTGLAVTDIEIYKGISTTQRASDAGYTLMDTDGIDVDGITGIHGFSIDTGDNTDAGFYAVGSYFTVIVSAVTIDSQTVNFVAATFRIVAAEAIAGKPKVDVDGWLGTACATPTVNGVPEVDVTHISGATTDVSTIPASVAAILVDTGTTLDGKIDTIDTNVDAILADTGTDGVLISDGTGAGQLDLSSGKVLIQGTIDQLDDVFSAVGKLLAIDDNAVTAASLAADAIAEIKAAVVAALATDTYAEPAQGTPAATTTLAVKLGFLYKAWRNKKDSDGTTENIYNDDAATVDHKRTIGESGGTVTKGEVATGP